MLEDECHGREAGRDGPEHKRVVVPGGDREGGGESTPISVSVTRRPSRSRIIASRSAPRRTAYSRVPIDDMPASVTAATTATNDITVVYCPKRRTPRYRVSTAAITTERASMAEVAGESERSAANQHTAGGAAVKEVSLDAGPVAQLASGVDRRYWPASRLSRLTWALTAGYPVNCQRWQPL